MSALLRAYNTEWRLFNILINYSTSLTDNDLLALDIKISKHIEKSQQELWQEDLLDLITISFLDIVSSDLPKEG